MSYVIKIDYLSPSGNFFLFILLPLFLSGTNSIADTRYTIKANLTINQTIKQPQWSGSIPSQDTKDFTIQITQKKKNAFLSIHFGNLHTGRHESGYVFSLGETTKERSNCYHTSGIDRIKCTGSNRIPYYDGMTQIVPEPGDQIDIVVDLASSVKETGILLVIYEKYIIRNGQYAILNEKDIYISVKKNHNTCSAFFAISEEEVYYKNFQEETERQTAKGEGNVGICLIDID